MIGAKLGGVLEIAKETLERSFLTYAKIRVSGFSSGFLPSVLEMPRGSDFVMLGIFPLNDNRTSSSVASGRALGPTFRRGEVLRRSLVDLNAHYQPDLHGKGNGVLNEIDTVATSPESPAKTVGVALQRRVFEGEHSVAKQVGDVDETSLYLDKTASKRTCVVFSAISDSNRNNKWGQVAESKYLPYSTALSDRIEVREGWVTFDTSTRKKTSGLIEGCTKALGDSHPRQKVNRGQLFQAQSSSYAEKLTANHETSFLPVKNSFKLLSPSITCSIDPDLFPPLAGLGLAQVRSKSQLISEMDLILQSEGPLALGWVLDRPISPGLTKAAVAASNYHKTKPMSPGLCSKRAHSEPITNFNSSLKRSTNFKQLRPKKFNDFTKGKILRWKDFEFHENRKKEKNPVGARGNSHANEIGPGKKVLHVYSRKKNKKVPPKDDMMNQDSDFFGDLVLGSEQNFEGDSQLLGRPDDTSLSSSSDSEETYVSKKIPEKDLDFQLEGLSLLLGDSEPIGDFTQSTPAPDSNVMPGPSINSFNGNLPTPASKENIENGSGCLEKDFYSPNQLEHKGNMRMEWKNAQALLTQMGIQLIHDTKKTTTKGMINKARGKKANRELQNLSFNVNFVGSSSRRGFPTSP